ncbi:MAG: site-specific DNA-methyltransferase [Phycisphaerales bacterium]|nr:site-specific DNA-methyltransferase [Phycisphaerales bacterium]
MNIEEKVRSNLFPWNGQFSPQLVHTLLETYGQKGGLVLDPFMGSGTVLVEAARLGMSAFGCEINPAACYMAQTYLMVNIQPAARRRYIEYVDRQLLSFEDSPLFGNSGADSAETKQRLLDLWRKEPDGPSRRLLQTLIVLLDFFRDDLGPKRIRDRWESLREIVLSLPYSPQLVLLANCDARKIPIKDARFDLVLTSPPYINVFNYHQQYRRSVELMGWDLLHVARSEIGSNRRNRQNRFLTAVQYCFDITQALSNLQRILKPTGRMIFVVGRESNVLRTPIYNGEIVANLGVRCAGLKIEARQERKFMNRFGTTIYEDLIHFTPGTSTNDSLSRARHVAKETLAAALDRVPESSRGDLEQAIDRIDEVKPSPMYEPLATETTDRKTYATAHAAS